MIKTITASQLKELMDKGEVTLIDVREPFEYQESSIEGSILIPLASVSKASLPPTTKPIVIHCRSGKRSADACQALLREDAALDVCSLDGGIQAWQAAGLSVNASCSTRLPLERQTLLAAGTIVLAGVLLGAWVSPLFYMLSGFAGCGLMFAGLTGWCGMAKLLALMPWNK